MCTVLTVGLQGRDVKFAVSEAMDPEDLRKQIAVALNKHSAVKIVLDSTMGSAGVVNLYPDNFAYWSVEPENVLSSQVF